MEIVSTDKKFNGLVEFAGKKTKIRKIIDDFNFVIAGLSKCDHRIHCSHILINDGEMAGTNGSRLHTCKCPVDGLPDGLYRVLKSAKTHTILFLTDHDYKTKYPKLGKLLKTKTKTIAVGIDFAMSGYWVKIARALPESATFNPDYMKSFNGVYDLEIAEDNMLFIVGDNRKAIIMPLRTDW